MRTPSKTPAPSRAERLRQRAAALLPAPRARRGGRLRGGAARSSCPGAGRASPAVPRTPPPRVDRRRCPPAPARPSLPVGPKGRPGSGRPSGAAGGERSKDVRPHAGVTLGRGATLGGGTAGPFPGACSAPRSASPARPGARARAAGGAARAGLPRAQGPAAGPPSLPPPPPAPHSPPRASAVPQHRRPVLQGTHRRPPCQRLWLQRGFPSCPRPLLNNKSHNVYFLCLLRCKCL